MDNHYVPNLTIGPMVCKALRDHGVTAPIDVHLMVSPVDCIVDDFAAAGASYITFHPEASPHIDRTLKLIDESGYDISLEIDGGVGVANIKEVAEAGVDMFVAGSAIFKEPRTVEAYKETIDSMRAELAAAKFPGLIAA